MKPRLFSSARISFPLATAIAALLAGQSAQAITYYWDNTGITSGFGSAAGTWQTGTVSQWSSGTGSSTGVATPGASVTTTTSDALNFGTDTATYGLGGGTITVTGTVNALSLRFGTQSTGNILLSGGTINFAAAATIHVGAGSTTVHTISSNITGAGTSLTKTGNSLTLSGTNSYLGSTIISSGTLTLGSTGALGGSTPGVDGTSGVTIGGTSAATLATTTDGITISAPITLANTGINSNISFSRSTGATGTLTLDGAIGGDGNLTYTTPNVSSGNNLQTVLINKAGTYAGTTTITTGNTNNTNTIKNGIANALPTSTVLTIDGGNGPASATVRTTTYDLGGFDQTLAGLTNTTGRVQRAQRVTNSGTLKTLTINNTEDFSYGSTVVDATTTTATITGALNLTKDGAGIQTLTGAANSYTGLTTVNAGALRIANNGSLGTTAGGTQVNGSSTGSAANARLELSGGITVTGETLTINGAGNFYGALNSFSGVNEWAGNVTLGSASTRLGAMNGTTLKVSGVIDSGVVNTGLFIRTESLTGVLIFSGANTYLGDTNLASGKLQLDGGNNRLPVATKVSMGNGSLISEFDLNGRSQEIAGLYINSLTTAANNSVNNSSSTLSTLNVNTATASPSTFAGILKGNLALTKTGADSLTLSGTNTYSGATTIKAGTLALDATGTIADSATVVVGDAGSSGTVLNLTAKSSFGFGSGQTVKGIGTINIGAGKTVTVAGNLAAGNSIGTITNTGNLALTGTLQSELGTPNASAASGVSDRTVVSGDLDLTGSTLQLIDNAGANSNGSAGAGAYRLMTYGGTLTGTFGTITNPLSATLHEKVVTGSGNVDLNLYRLATGSTSAVALGKARVGDTLTGSLTTTNSATADGFSEKLNASVGSNAGHVNASSGSVSGVIAGANASTINVGLSTATSGAKSGSVLVSYVSDGTGTSGYSTTTNGSQTVGVTGSVYELASANLTQTAGAAISGSGPSYSLDFGSGLDLDTLYTASFSIQNGVVVNSFIDTLSGGYSLTSGAFSTTAVDFSGLAAGAAANLFNITFQTNSAGSYNGTFTFDGTSVQSGLDNVSVGDFTIALSATAVPEPNVAALLGGLGALMLLRRRR